MVSLETIKLKKKCLWVLAQLKVKLEELQSFSLKNNFHSQFLFLLSDTMSACFLKDFLVGKTWNHWIWLSIYLMKAINHVSEEVWGSPSQGRRDRSFLYVEMEGRHLLWSQRFVINNTMGKTGFQGKLLESLEGSSNMLLDFSWRVFSNPGSLVCRRARLCRWVACRSQFKYGEGVPHSLSRFTGCSRKVPLLEKLR